MNMPDIVEAFFDADSRNDADSLSQTFSSDAVVEDEGARHQGKDAIRRWWVAAKEAAQYIADPIETTGVGDTVFVRAKISGQFPGSPVKLNYSFTIEDGEITRLEIR